MYERYYGLREKPFTLRPDPGFLYFGSKHSIAYSMLEYGLVNEAGIIVITGEIGSGKTTLIRHLLNHLDSSSSVGLISNTHKAFGVLIEWISNAFDLPHEGKDKVALYRQFVDFLIREYSGGKRVVLIVDEAQNMDPGTLEELRVISNVNADKDLVLQLILVGQPELRATLGRAEMEQFAQRIAADYHLAPLDVHETGEYVNHRLRVAGGDPGLFEPEAIECIYHSSGGIPRLINSLCDQSLVYAFAEQIPRVTVDLVAELVKEKQDAGAFGLVRRKAANAPPAATPAALNESPTMTGSATPDNGPARGLFDKLEEKYRREL